MRKPSFTVAGAMRARQLCALAFLVCAAMPMVSHAQSGCYQLVLRDGQELRTDDLFQEVHQLHQRHYMQLTLDGKGGASIGSGACKVVSRSLVTCVQPAGGNPSGHTATALTFLLDWSELRVVLMSADAATKDVGGLKGITADHKALMQAGLINGPCR